MSLSGQKERGCIHGANSTKLDNRCLTFPPIQLLKRAIAAEKQGLKQSRTLIHSLSLFPRAGAHVRMIKKVS